MKYVDRIKIESTSMPTKVWLMQYYEQYFFELNYTSIYYEITIGKKAMLNKIILEFLQVLYMDLNFDPTISKVTHKYSRYGK